MPGLACAASGQVVTNTRNNRILLQATVAAQPDIPTLTADWLKACERTNTKVSAAQ